LCSLREHNKLLCSGITDVEAAGEGLSQKCHCLSVLCGSRCLHNGGSTCTIVHSSVQYTVGTNRNIIMRYCGLYEHVLFFGHRSSSAVPTAFQWSCILRRVTSFRRFEEAWVVQDGSPILQGKFVFIVNIVHCGQNAKLRAFPAFYRSRRFIKYVAHTHPGSIFC
jgi:hypothetical protein